MIGKGCHGPEERLMNLETDDLHVNPEYPHFPDSPHYENVTGVRIKWDNKWKTTLVFQVKF